MYSVDFYHSGNLFVLCVSIIVLKCLQTYLRNIIATVAKYTHTQKIQICCWTANNFSQLAAEKEGNFAFNK